MKLFSISVLIGLCINALAMPITVDYMSLNTDNENIVSIYKNSILDHKETFKKQVEHINRYYNMTFFQIPNILLISNLE